MTSTPSHNAFSYDDIGGNSFPQYQKNYCPATIHLLIKNLENTNYSCKMCNKYTSLYYSHSEEFPSASTSASSASYSFGSDSSPIALVDSHIRSIQANRNLVVSCNFCKKNGEIPFIYQSHELKNDEGKVMCPVLRKYRCEMCNATGDNAHTKKYCPKYVAMNEQLPVFRRLANGVISNIHNHK